MERVINKSLLSIPIMFQKTGEELVFEDGRFTKVKVWMMHLGENANGSVFDKEVVDEALSTLSYIPIVGFIEENFGEEDFSDHRYIITKDEDGVRRKYIGSAYGVILSSDDNNAHYEDRECDDGITRTFVVVDGIIWNMFEDGSKILNRDLIKSHSMELYDAVDAVDGYMDENGLFHFTKFSFRAACILGDKYEPAMMNSTIEVQFTMTDFVKSLHSELNDKFTIFTKLVNEKTNQGGVGIMPNTEFTQTVLELFTDVSNLVSQYEVIKDVWGDDVPRYYLQDIQDDEVIVIDRKNNYQYYGFPLTINGDKPEIDFANGNRKKIKYDNYVEETDSKDNFDFGKHITEIETSAFEKVNQANEKFNTAEQDKMTAETNYNQIKNDYDEMKIKYDAYVKEDEKRKADALNAQKDEKFAEYEDVLADNVDFMALKNRKDELSVDDIEKECAVLFVKISRGKSNFSKNGQMLSLELIDDSDDSEGFVLTKYGNIPVDRK